MKYHVYTKLDGRTVCLHVYTNDAEDVHILRMHIIHRVTFTTVAGPYLTNRNDSYQSSSCRIASHRIAPHACVCVHTRARVIVEYLRIVFFCVSLAETRRDTRSLLLPRMLSSFVSYFSRAINSVVQIFVVDADDDEREEAKEKKGEKKSGRRRRDSMITRVYRRKERVRERQRERKSGTSEISRAADTYGSRRSAR